MQPTPHSAAETFAAFGGTPILVVMGVSGSGKSTVAALLAEQLGWDRQEGDELHPAANVAKMASGQPLTDDDRWPWLDRIAAWIDAHQVAGRPGVVTCSALKREYRTRLARRGVMFVHLAGGRDTIAHRLAERKGHYMPPSLLGSQFQTLEPLDSDEAGIVVDARQSPGAEVAEILERFELTRSTQ
ncbi:gluconokinase [Microbacterium sp. SS28]|uniref:gluconokinase n=1 Tax=Microbacterium sp. SS28 TaxID=2919948 RepID=UPI001FAAE55F|nr:gluconokinase [Microbacterium sp. SS28]